MQNPCNLTLVQEYASACITTILTDSATRLRLLGMGLSTGSQVEVLRNRQGDMLLSQGNNRISLGESLAKQILVQPVNA